MLGVVDQRMGQAAGRVGGDRPAQMADVEVPATRICPWERVACPRSSRKEHWVIASARWCQLRRHLVPRKFPRSRPATAPTDRRGSSMVSPRLPGAQLPLQGDLGPPQEQPARRRSAPSGGRECRQAPPPAPGSGFAQLLRHGGGASGRALSAVTATDPRCAHRRLETPRARAAASDPFEQHVGHQAVTICFEEARRQGDLLWPGAALERLSQRHRRPQRSPMASRSTAIDPDAMATGPVQRVRSQGCASPSGGSSSDQARPAGGWRTMAGAAPARAGPPAPARPDPKASAASPRGPAPRVCRIIAPGSLARSRPERGRDAPAGGHRRPTVPAPRGQAPTRQPRGGRSQRTRPGLGL